MKLAADLQEVLEKIFTYTNNTQDKDRVEICIELLRTSEGMPRISENYYESYYVVFNNTGIDVHKKTQSLLSGRDDISIKMFKINEEGFNGFKELVALL